MALVRTSIMQHQPINKAKHGSLEIWTGLCLVWTAAGFQTATSCSKALTNNQGHETLTNNKPSKIMRKILDIVGLATAACMFITM